MGLKKFTLFLDSETRNYLQKAKGAIESPSGLVRAVRLYGDLVTIMTSNLAPAFGGFNDVLVERVVMGEVEHFAFIDEFCSRVEANVRYRANASDGEQIALEILGFLRSDKTPLVKILFCFNVKGIFTRSASHMDLEKYRKVFKYM